MSFFLPSIVKSRKFLKFLKKFLEVIFKKYFYYFFILLYFWVVVEKNMCTDTLWSEFAFVLFRQIYSYCEEWLEHNKENRDPALEYNIQTLMHFVHPMRWRAGGSPKKSDVDIITTLLASIYAPSFREKAPDLWEKIDRATLTFAIYSTPDFKSMGSDGTVIEATPKITTPQPQQHQPKDETLQVPTPVVEEEEKEHVDDNDDVDGFKLKRQRNFEPKVIDPIELLNETVEEVEREELNEDNDEDEENDDDDETVVEDVDDEILKTPFNKRREVSTTPRYNLRTTKIIVWNPTTQNKKH